MLGEGCIFLGASVKFLFLYLDECTERSMSVGLPYKNVKQQSKQLQCSLYGSSGNGYLGL